MSTQLVSGDSYILDMYIWENEAGGVRKDLSLIQGCEYTLWNSTNWKTPIFTAEWKKSPYILIPDPTNGHIIVDLRGDLQLVTNGQLYHKITITDESGRKITVLNEYITLTVLPFHKQ